MAGKRLIIFSFFALVAVTLALFAASGTDAQSYDPILSYTLDDPGGGAASDSHNVITINAPDYNYEDSSMFSLVPLGMDSKIVPVLGAGMGALSASSTVGLLGGPCNSVLPPKFDLYNASTDNSPGNELSPADMYWLLKDKDDFPIPYDGDDPQLPDYVEGYPHFLNEMLDPDGAGDLTPLRPHARYAGHDFVASMNILIQIVVFNPGDLEQLPGIYAQMDDAIGTPSLVVLNNPVSADEAPGAISDFCTPLWTDTTLYATTANNSRTGAINDGCPAVGDAETGGECGLDRYDDDDDGKINDGCPQVGGTGESGAQCNNDLDDDDDPPDESGTAAQQNPPSNTGVLNSGTHVARNYSRSERDADGDGHENDMDPCKYSDDSGWDPRANCTGIPPTKPGDVDCDGLPTSCDPDDNTKNTDQDGDGYDNGQDICALVANGCQDSTCHPTIFNPAWDNQADDDTQLPNADLGPGPDSIGNACDDSDNDGSEDGCGAGTCTDGIDNGAACDGTGTDGMDQLDADCAAAMDDTDADPWGTNPGTGQFYHALPVAAVCVGGEECPGCVNDVDDDGDTVVNDGCPAKDAPENPLTECEDDIDDDGDTRVNDGCPIVDILPENPDCANDIDDDGDTNVNDGCPAKDDPEDDACVDALDDGEDDPADGKVNDGCPAKDAPEVACEDAIDDDGDTRVNDGCPAVDVSEGDVDECANAIDDDGDTNVNDGCPAKNSNVDSDGDGYCDTLDSYTGSDPDDSGKTPETLIIDAVINAPGGNPSADVPQSCNDGVDNDGDTWVDAADIGCQAAAVGNDDDHDGWADDEDDVWRFQADVAGDHVGMESIYDDPTKDVGEYTYNNITGDVYVGTNNQQCMIAVPMDEDVAAGGVNDNELEIQVLCFGTPVNHKTPYLTLTIDGPGDTDIDILWWKWWKGTEDPTGLDNCPSVWNPEQDNTDVVLALAGASNGGVVVTSDAVGDACDDDTDGDGWLDVIEAYLRTDRYDNCPDWAGEHDAWPLDNNVDGSVTVVGDVLPYSGNIGLPVSSNPSVLQRLDLDANGSITVVGDVLPFSGKIGNSCT